MSFLTSSCQFFTNRPCSLLPCASLVFFRYLFTMLPQGSLGFLLFHTRTSSDWSRGFSSCYHLKMGKHIAKSSSPTFDSVVIPVSAISSLGSVCVFCRMFSCCFCFLFLSLCNLFILFLVIYPYFDFLFSFNGD